MKAKTGLLGMVPSGRREHAGSPVRDVGEPHLLDTLSIRDEVRRSNFLSDYETDLSSRLKSSFRTPRRGTERHIDKEKTAKYDLLADKGRD